MRNPRVKVSEIDSEGEVVEDTTPADATAYIKDKLNELSNVSNKKDRVTVGSIIYTGDNLNGMASYDVKITDKIDGNKVFKTVRFEIPQEVDMHPQKVDAFESFTIVNRINNNKKNAYEYDLQDYGKIKAQKMQDNSVHFSLKYPMLDDNNNIVLRDATAEELNQIILQSGGRGGKINIANGELIDETFYMLQKNLLQLARQRIKQQNDRNAEENAKQKEEE